MKWNVLQIEERKENTGKIVGRIKFGDKWNVKWMLPPKLLFSNIDTVYCEYNRQLLQISFAFFHHLSFSPSRSRSVLFSLPVHFFQSQLLHWAKIFKEETRKRKNYFICMAQSHFCSPFFDVSLHLRFVNKNSIKIVHNLNGINKLRFNRVSEIERERTKEKFNKRSRQWDKWSKNRRTWREKKVKRWEAEKSRIENQDVRTHTQSRNREKFSICGKGHAQILIDCNWENVSLFKLKMERGPSAFPAASTAAAMLWQIHIGHFTERQRHR